jgi:hypothetical protein
MIPNTYLFYGFLCMMLVILLTILLENMEFFLTYMTSSVNNKEYGIQDEFHNTSKAVDTLATLHDKMIEYADKLKNRYSNDERVIRMWNRLSKIVIEEAPDEEDSSTYTINKGELMALCLRPKMNNGKIDGKSFHDHNTLWFVVAHELAHIMSLSEGHGSEFVDNFRFILRTSNELGFYNNPIDYSNNPITYCGVKVTNNPFY